MWKLVTTVILLCFVNNVLSGETVLYWSSSQTRGSRSCLYSLEGDPATWVHHLTLGGEVYPNPLCVPKSTFKLGALASNIFGTYQVYSADGVDGGLIDFEASHSGEALSLPATGARNIQGVAYDWLSDSLYFTDTELGVGIAGRDRTLSRVLLESVSDPAAIVVDPTAGYLFYVEAGAGRVWRSSLSGEAAVTVIDNLSADGQILLALDRAAAILYYLDQAAATLYSAAYDGSAQTTVRTFSQMTPGEIAGLEVSEGYMFLLLADESCIWILDMVTGTDVTSMIFPDVNGVVYHGLAMAAANDTGDESPCSVDNGGCEQICVHQPPTSRQCLCAWGYQLDTDGVSCTSEFQYDDFMIASDMRTGKAYHVNTQTGDVQGIPLDQNPNPLLLQGVTYDINDNLLYWIDTGSSMLFRKPLAHGVITENVYNFTEASVIESIVLDEEGANLYFSDSERHLIGRLSLDTLQQETVVSLTPSEFPLRIQLDDYNRAVYWTNVGNPASIERVSIDDSTNRESLVSSGVAYPSGLAIDFQAGRLYWADWGLGKVESVDVSSSPSVDRQTLALVEDAYTVTLDTNYIYVGTSNEIKKYNRDGVAQARLGPNFFSIIYDIHLYSSTLPKTMTTQIPHTTPSEAAFTVVYSTTLMMTLALLSMCFLP